MPMLIGGLGLGFEGSNWYRTQRVMQNAADAAVLAATFNGGANYDVEGKAVAARLGFTDCVNGVGVTVLLRIGCPQFKRERRDQCPVPRSMRGRGA